MATTTMQSETETTKRSGPRKVAKTKRAVKARAAPRRKAKTDTSEGLGTQLYRQGRDAVSGVYDTASTLGTRARRAMPKLRGGVDLRSRRESVYSTMEEHPLVIGAVGLGVGMVLAAMLPSMNRRNSHR
jgi:hypothetical protein